MRAMVLLLFVAAAGADEEEAMRAEGKRAVAAVEAYLGPKFEAPVRFEILSSREAAERLTGSSVYGADTLAMLGRVARRLKQIPPGMNIVDTAAAMAEQGVGGLYDPETRKLLMVRGQPPPLRYHCLVHEVVHAYRHVDHDYPDRVLASAGDLDRMTALSFLIEGDASLLAEAIAPLGGTIADEVDVEHLVRAADTRRITARRWYEAEQWKEYPRILREGALAPYVEGPYFAARVYVAGGLAALDAAYRAPPRSTEQVLHPEKYIGAEPDEPTVFRAGDPTPALGAGWRLGVTDVMGEFEMRIHFADALGRTAATRAAAGWDGARYWYCVDAAGTGEFFGMVTTWDTEEDAAEFAAAWARWAARRDGDARRVARIRDDGGYALMTRDGPVVLRVRGKDVWIADGGPPGKLADALDRMEAVERAERAFERPR